MLRSKILPAIVWVTYRLLWATWRHRIYEPPEMLEALERREPIVLSHWHGDELAILFLLHRYRATAMISTSKDGELMNTVLTWSGIPTARGSSTRGGVGALRGILRLSKQGYNPSVAVDGPKGPIYQVKPGVFEIAKLTGAKIFPLGACCHNSYTFERAWNKTYLPYPFAKIGIYWGPSIGPISRDADGRTPELANQLAEALSDARRKALNLIATP